MREVSTGFATTNGSGDVLAGQIDNLTFYYGEDGQLRVKSSDYKFSQTGGQDDLKKRTARVA